MTTLTRNEPFASREPTLAIDAGLLPGTHRFQLEVVDTAGLRSLPAAVTVVVQRRVIPVPGPVPGPVVRSPATGPAVVVASPAMTDATGVLHPAVAALGAHVPTASGHVGAPPAAAQQSAGAAPAVPAARRP